MFCGLLWSHFDRVLTVPRHALPAVASACQWCALGPSDPLKQRVVSFKGLVAEARLDDVTAAAKLHTVRVKHSVLPSSRRESCGSCWDAFGCNLMPLRILCRQRQGMPEVNADKAEQHLFRFREFRCALQVLEAFAVNSVPSQKSAASVDRELLEMLEAPLTSAGRFLQRCNRLCRSGWTCHAGLQAGSGRL